MRYEGKTVLITGGTGFIGGRLAERLALEEGASVRALVRNWASAVWVSRVRAALVQGDVTDADSVAEAMNGCSVVFHCASGGESRDEYLATNVGGTRNVLDAALTTGVERVVHISSIAVHGPSPPNGANEDAPFVPTGKAYGDSKIEAEQLVWQYWREHELPVTVVRPTFVWGPRSGLFTSRPLRAMKSRAFALIDAGSGSCNAVYVDNLVDAILLAGLRPEAVGEAFIVTDGLDVTWSDFFGHYARLLGVDLSSFPSLRSRSPLVRFGARAREFLEGLLVALSPNPAPLWRRAIRRSARIARDLLVQRGTPTPWDLAKYARRGALDTSKAGRMLGYSPRYSLEDGMRDTLVWVKDQMGYDLDIAHHA